MIAMSVIHLAASADIPPESRRTYVITPEEGAPFFGFYDDAKEVTGGGLSIELDTPWAPNTRIIKKTAIKSSEAERPEERNKRVSEGIRNAGLAYVNGLFYNAAEVQLAERAREMAGIGKTAGAANEPPTGEAQEVQSAGTVEGDQANGDNKAKSAIIAQWGTHIGIVLLASILLGIVAFTLVFRRRS